MSGVRISQLLSAVGAQPTDELEINQGGGSRKISIAQIVAGVSGRVTEGPNPPVSPGRGQLWLNTTFPSESVWQFSLYDGGDWIALGFVDSINNTFEPPTPTKNLPMGGFRHTGVANGVARTDYAALGQAQDGAVLWGGTAGGTANALTISLNPPITAYAAGQEFRFISGASANTGAVTLNVNGIGGVAINKGNGAAALTAGELPALAMVTVRHDGTQFRLLDPVDSIAIPDASVTTAKLAFDGGALSGMRNLIINGNPVINQRGYVSGAATTVANQYTLDRWRVVVSGQSLSWTDSAGIRTVTFPAGGGEQVIEALNNLGGVHTLSWKGTATATVNGASVAKGGQVTLTGNANVTIRMSGGTGSEIQLEPGTVATPFERRQYGAELALCQSYYRVANFLVSGVATAAGQDVYGNVNFAPMRAAPTVVKTAGTFTNSTNPNPMVVTASSISDFIRSAAAGVIYGQFTAQLAAEL